MKKYNGVTLILLGFVLGVSISYAPQLEAAASKLLGSKVGNVLQVKIDDKNIGEGAVINGTTYVPLRVTANEMGLEVTKVDSKEVVLSSGEGSEVPVNDIPNTGSQITDNSDKIRTQIAEIDSKISQINVKIKYAEDILSNKPGLLRQIERNKETMDIMLTAKESGGSLYTESGYNQLVQDNEKTTKTISDAERDLPVLKQQLEDLEKQKADLEAQLK